MGLKGGMNQLSCSRRCTDDFPLGIGAPGAEGRRSLLVSSHQYNVAILPAWVQAAFAHLQCCRAGVSRGAEHGADGRDTSLFQCHAWGGAGDRCRAEEFCNAMGQVWAVEQMIRTGLVKYLVNCCRCLQCNLLPPVSLTKFL